MVKGFVGQLVELLVVVAKSTALSTQRVYPALRITG
jgi:hypothetical protein